MVQRALIIGVRYRRWADCPRVTLSGTHEDAVTMRELLLKYGYPADGIRMLLDTEDEDSEELRRLSYAKPTYREIERQMEELVYEATSGDSFVFYFAGHGSQVPALACKLEDDGYDEVIWPSDVVLLHPQRGSESEVANYVLDDLIHEKLTENLPTGVHMTLIFDACHSGTAADLLRSCDDIRANLLSTGALACDNTLCNLCTAVASSPGVKPKLSIAMAAKIHAWMVRCASKPKAMPTVVAWAACRDSENAYETTFGAQRQTGIFTSTFRELAEKQIEEGTQTTNSQLLHDLTQACREKLENVATKTRNKGTVSTAAKSERSRGSAAERREMHPQLATLYNLLGLLELPFRL